jgi:patatin-like phospholipase/acyl hydrolase
MLFRDGGGMRGVITTTILERITQEFPDFLSKIDYVAGCSNGGMVAMGMLYYIYT